MFLTRSCLVLTMVCAACITSCASQMTSTTAGTPNVARSESSAGYLSLEDKQNIQAAIDPQVIGYERALVGGFMAADTRIQDHAAARRWGVVVISIDGGNFRIFANEPEFRSAVDLYKRVPGSSTLWVNTRGEIKPFPEIPPPEQTPDAQPLIPVDTSRGPYRRMLTTPNNYVSMQSYVGLTCNGATMPHGSGVDTGYAYMGGFPSAAYGNEVEAGLQFSAKYGHYTPYMRIPDVNGGLIIEMRDDLHLSYNNPPLNWSCSLPTTQVAFQSWGWCPSDQGFAEYSGKCFNGSTPPDTGFSFVASNWPEDNNPNTYQEIAVSVLTTAYPWPQGADASKGTWPCLSPTCSYQLITSIAQAKTNLHPNPAEKFGGITWDSVEYFATSNVGGEKPWQQSLTKACQDFPDWTSPNGYSNTECGNTPGSASDKDILVQGFGYSYPYNGTTTLSQTVTISI